VLVSGTDGIGINAAGATVILRNLRINGIGSGVNGINLMAAARLRVENVAIERFAASGINVSVGANATVMVQNTSIEGCATGISVQTSAGQAKATLNDVSISCTTGVAALAGANVTLHNSTVEGAITGVSIGTGGTATIDSSQIRYTTTGVQIDGSNSVLRLSNASILDNTTGIVATNSPKIYSYNNNRLTGNVTDGASPTTTYYQR
jgi:hypothetical protein